MNEFPPLTIFLVFRGVIRRPLLDVHLDIKRLEPSCASLCLTLGRGCFQRFSALLVLAFGSSKVFTSLLSLFFLFLLMLPPLQGIKEFELYSWKPLMS